MTDAAVRKLFAKLAEIERRLGELDTNGKLDLINKEMSEIKKKMTQVEANSRVGVNTVESHGAMIMRMEKLLTRLELRCPELKPKTDEFPEVTERVKMKDE